MKKTAIRIVVIIIVAAIAAAAYYKRCPTATITPESIEAQLEELNFCEMDSDCALVYAPCPFGCRKVVNAQLAPQATEIMESYRLQQAALWNPQCEYGCVDPEHFQISCAPIEKKCMLDTQLPPAEQEEIEEPEWEEGDILTSDNPIVQNVIDAYDRFWRKLKLIEPTEFSYDKQSAVSIFIDTSNPVFADMFGDGMERFAYDRCGFVEESSPKYNNLQHYENVYNTFKNLPVKRYIVAYTGEPIPADWDGGYNGVYVLIVDNALWYTTLEDAKSDVSYCGAGGQWLTQINDKYLLFLDGFPTGGSEPFGMTEISNLTQTIQLKS